jgi:hypothetical protein
MSISKHSNALLKRTLAEIIEEELWEDEPAVIVAVDGGAEWLRQRSERRDGEPRTCRSWGGSRPGKKPNKRRDFDAAFEKLQRQYDCKVLVPLCTVLMIVYQVFMRRPCIQ